MCEVTKKLLSSLKELENSIDPIPYCVDENGKTSRYIDSNKCKLANTIIIDANTALITPTGGCDWEAIGFIRSNGYGVFAGEKDSFGWLTGCIRTKVGIVVYG